MAFLGSGFTGAPVKGHRRLFKVGGNTSASPTRKYRVATGWRCRYGGIKYEVDTTGFPPELVRAVEVVQEGHMEVYQEAMKCILEHRFEFPALRVVLVDMMCVKEMRDVRIARDALYEVAEECDIPSLLKPFKGLNYSAQAECLNVFRTVGSPRIFPFILECAVDHQISRVRRVACGCLANLQYSDREMANKAFSALLDLTDCEDWGVRYAAMVSLETFALPDLVDADLRARVKPAFALRANSEIEEELVVRTKAKMFLAAPEAPRTS